MIVKPCGIRHQILEVCRPEPVTARERKKKYDPEDEPQHCDMI